MDNIGFTILAAVVLMVLVAIFLASGRLLTGKNRLRRGSCGMIPSKDKKDDKGKGSCSICGAKKSCDAEEEKSDSGTHTKQGPN